jgi:hypothetical protein
MGKKEAGQSVGRYSIPLTESEVNKVIDFISAALDDYGVKYSVKVEDDETKETEEKSSWTYGLFAERKHITFTVEGLDFENRDYRSRNYYYRALFTGIKELRFIFTKERGVSSYEKLQEVDSSLRHYPEVVPYCDIDYYTLDNLRFCMYRLYRGRRWNFFEGKKGIGHYNTSLDDSEFAAGIKEFVHDICEHKGLNLIRK